MNGHPHLDYSQVAPGSIIDGGGLAVFLRDRGNGLADCINLIGSDAGKVTEWGPAAEILVDARDATLADFWSVARSYGLDEVQAGDDPRCEESLGDLGKLLWRESQREYELVGKSIDLASAAHASLHQEVATLLKTAAILTERAAAIIAEEDS